jgi:hypothetical protein
MERLNIDQPRVKGSRLVWPFGLQVWNLGTVGGDLVKKIIAGMGTGRSRDETAAKQRWSRIERSAAIW